MVNCWEVHIESAVDRTIDNHGRCNSISSNTVLVYFIMEETLRHVKVYCKMYGAVIKS